ncbi:uncharacterized protein N7469_002013 [Penicillium citrinum]|uniref:Uncharacterized protein n=1 Tax=Penicillium citrinum TaxID=5077 RepID=A0A9W9P9Q0_PENCI|nr:uncharacterized protein N7469_002013 [Penicillium citrinum]KAJ5240422.1 hypothetical protein N7469_002013 [Penicillium citrinum]
MTYVVDDDVEDIFGRIHQYLHSGNYSVLVPAAHKSSHVACEDEVDPATQDLFPLKEKYFTSHKDIQKKSDNSMSLPHCGDGNYLCKHPKTLLMHARLYAFATKHGLNRLAYVSLQKLYWTLSGFPLDLKQANTIVELLRLSNEMDDIDVLIIHFISFLKEDHNLSCRLFAQL